MGERGARLSGGERQWVAIARALLRDKPILALDESVSMLDAISERDLQRAVAEVRAGRTALVIAHRLSTILAADRIVVLEQSRVVGAGTHTDLLEDCPAYARLVDAQWTPPNT
ncbi:MAG: ATP-binding cassette domain-containing protein [Egibacteraceae bacterium]